MYQELLQKLPTVISKECLEISIHRSFNLPSRNEMNPSKYDFNVHRLKYRSHRRKEQMHKTEGEQTEAIIETFENGREFGYRDTGSSVCAFKFNFS